MTVLTGKKRLNNSHARRSATGFTLVELMVTIAILAIVTTVAVPSFNSLVQGNRLTGVTNQLLSAYQGARSEAIKRSQNVMLCATTDGISCAAKADWSSWLVLAGNEVVAQGRSSNNLVVSGPANTSIVFTPAGLVRDNSGAGLASSIRVCTKSSSVTENTRTLTFVAGGAISIARGASACA
ncbi:GspH/FimT family pseudopilin [Rheinheimera nanhaiensis]|uniref:Type II secretion system protein H n=1 Tax=Rheinheimera nanhaiensis E407-8 TaxID=562729 RepID=I1DUY3_9GAMM|nr:GspH/FimT family pseudopilin [Rheinheimera nanhaiensis]GAB57861.1 pre-pilin like leader sequence [Rheinheimera nanhaiensis E407-8]